MRQTKLRTKLIGGFGFCVVVIAVLNVYAIIQIQSLGRLQDESIRKAREAETATRASFIGQVSYSIIAEAIINGQLDKVREAWAAQKKVNQELLKQVQGDVTTDEERARLKKSEENYRELVKHFEEELIPLLEKGADMATVSKVDDEIDEHKVEMRENLDVISNSFKNTFLAADERYDHQRSQTVLFCSILAVGGVVGAVLAGIILTLSVTRPIQRAVSGLSESAEQVASASGHISLSSQELAGGASQQAAAVEQTSSSLEQMSSMTRQNADNSRQADEVMKNAVHIVGRANQSMSDLTTSMLSITRASEETQKIIRTIDEIAFQTNLLALNAAVEAARAGEAGAGFAVVADEVRNLALRAAEAAKNTALLIEGTVKEVRQGSDLVGRTNVDFKEVSTSISKVGDLLGEIAAASHEQAQGIDQINRAVSDMDKVTQQNAANSEESASAAEELSAQARNLRVFVAELSAIIGMDSQSAEEEPHGAQSPRREQRRVVVSSRRPPQRGGTGVRKGIAQTGEVRPERLLPLGDEEF